MSEFEKQQRDAYQRKRKKWILIQSVIVGVLVLGMLITGLVYYKMDKDTYVYYTEEGNVIHRAYLAENNFYEEDYLNGSHAYVSSLIEKMTGDFTYKLKLDTSDVNFKYSYKIEAQVSVAEKSAGTAIFNPVFELVPEKTITTSGNALSIHELIDIDFQKYNTIAQNFVDQYGLDSFATRTLYVRMHVEVLGESEQFAENNTGEYVVTLSVPLNEEIAKPSVSTSVPADELKILACDNNSKTGFLIAAIILAVLSAAAAIVLIVYMYKTRDIHINYARKVQKIVSNYKSYIQKILNPFDTTNYQILYVDTFTEMLEIRDTLQIPVLMYENEDKTCAQFMIVTAGVLYIYEIRVEHYDEIYHTADLPTVEDEEENTEEPVILEEVDDEVLAYAMSTPDIELSEIEFVDEIDEETEEGVEVIGVVWPEHKHKNKIYRYDPNGEILEDGDVVLIPSRDVHSNRDIIRKAAVAHGNHRVDPEMLKHPLKKIIGIVHRASYTESAQTEDVEKDVFEE